MANKYRTILEAVGIGKLWNGESFDSLIPPNEKEYKDYIGLIQNHCRKHENCII